MLHQISSNQLLIPMLETRLEANELAYTKEEVVELVEKLFRYGKHVGLHTNTYNKDNLLVRKGVKANSSYMQVHLIDVEKLQRNRVEGELVFYSERAINESNWFVSYFHAGDWLEQLTKVVTQFQEQCFKQ